MKTRLRNEQSRCRVAGEEESLVIDFFSGACPEQACGEGFSNYRRVSRQKKNT